MTKKEFLDLDEKGRFDWMISEGWKVDESGQVYSCTGKSAGSVDKVLGYVKIGPRLEDGNLSMLAHRFVFYFLTGEMPEHVDHINRLKHDNRLVNLRSVTHQQNMFNKNSKGYCIDKRTDKWRAHIMVNGVLCT
jgi:hypothetical protein